MSQIRRRASPALGLRRINVEARRQRILAATRRLISRGGVEALTMRKLAREAGLSVTTLYNLFGAREDILHALIMDAIDRMDEALDREAPLDDPIERCRAIVTVSVRHMAEHEAIFRPMLIAAAASPSRAPSRAVERAAQLQATAIGTAIERGLLTDLLDPAELGRQIYHGWEHASEQWARGEIDERGFEARALYGLDVALLGVASRRIRPRLETELRKLEKRLAATAGKRRRKARRRG